MVEEKKAFCVLGVYELKEMLRELQKKRPYERYATVILRGYTSEGTAGETQFNKREFKIVGRGDL